MRRLTPILGLACALALCTAGRAACAQALNRSGFVPTFSAEFNEPAGSPLDRKTWRTRYYFGAPDVSPTGAPATRSVQFISRTVSGEKEVYVDEPYCGQDPFHIASGTLTITARQADATAAQTCGAGGLRTILSGLITTQNSFSQTYGYFEMRAKLPLGQGLWPAFWMLPTTRTPSNLGRLPEFDIVEHWAGHITLMSRGIVPVEFDRTGKPISTVHFGRAGVESSLGNAQSAPTIDVTQFHTYGLLWTASRLVWYLDDRETFETPFVNADPHYLLANLAVDGRYPNPGPFPAEFVIDYIRAFQIPSGRR
jgi:beta-glucanase (GH16 family)